MLLIKEVLSGGNFFVQVVLLRIVLCFSWFCFIFVQGFSFELYKSVGRRGAMQLLDL